MFFPQRFFGRTKVINIIGGLAKRYVSLRIYMQTDPTSDTDRGYLHVTGSRGLSLHGVTALSCIHFIYIQQSVAIPVALARAATRLVLPTPGLPSSKTAFFSCSARSTRITLPAVVLAWKSKPWPLTGAGAAVLDTQKGAMPQTSSPELVDSAMATPVSVLSSHTASCRTSITVSPF